jgi:hypothetical protein
MCLALKYFYIMNKVQIQSLILVIFIVLYSIHCIGMSIKV